jgi:hypothetical protein
VLKIGGTPAALKTVTRPLSFYSNILLFNKKGTFEGGGLSK